MLDLKRIITLVICFVVVFYFITKDVNFCSKWYMSKDFTLSLTSILFILPLCFSKRIDFLKYVRYLKSTVEDCYHVQQSDISV